MKKTEIEFVLDHEGIDAIAQQLEVWLREKNTDKSYILRLRLTVEELLLRLQERGKNRQVFLCLAEGLYRDTLLLRYPGGRLNPVEKAADGAEEITERMLQTMGLSPIWRYRGAGIKSFSACRSGRISRNSWCWAP